jgi:hypothetical protein
MFLGAKPGTKWGLAWAMYSRPEGATRDEVIAVCGGPQQNAATDAAREGGLEFTAKRRDDGHLAYFIGPVGSQPGGPDARAVGRRTSTLPDVTQNELVVAIRAFDRDLRDTREWTEWEHNNAHRYAIRHNERLYPVKQIVSLATGIPTSEFSGGESHANTYVTTRGLEVIRLRDEGAQDHPQYI